MHVCLIGDSHGNVRFLRHTLTQISALRDRLQVDVLAISLGDFGFWPSNDGVDFIEAVTAAVDATGVPLWVIDGNHDYPGSRGQPEGYRHWSNPSPDPAATRFCHLPRGTRFRLGNTVFGICGGAVSIDRRSRTPGSSWWPEEAIADADVERIEGTGQVDVMLSHDSPWPPPGSELYHDPRDPTLAGDLVDNQQRLRTIVSHWQPRLVVHGHWHHPYTALIKGDETGHDARVIGLDYENFETSTHWLDTSSDIQVSTTGDNIDPAGAAE